MSRQKSDHIRYSPRRGFTGITAKDKAEWLKRYPEIKDFDTEVRDIEKWLSHYPEQCKIAKAHPRNYLDCQLAPNSVWSNTSQQRQPKAKSWAELENKLHKNIEASMDLSLEDNPAPYVTQDDYNRFRDEAYTLHKDNPNAPPLPYDTDDATQNAMRLREYCRNQLQGKDRQDGIEEKEKHKKITKLTDFIRNNCEDTTSISSKANRIHEFVKKDRIDFMPKPINETKGNETKLYNEKELRQIWPKLKEKIKSLPNLKD